MTSSRRRLQNYWQHNVSEVLSDPGLVIFTALLVITHIIHSFYYKPSLSMFGLLGEGTDGLCYTAMSDCLSRRFMSAWQVNSLIIGYRVLGFTTLALILLKPVRKPGLCMLLALTLIKNFIILHDARLYSGHNYITNLLTIVLFLIPHKRLYITWSFVLVYFWSGVLHLNPQWLDGTLLREGWNFFPEFLSLQTKYVVILQMFFSWGLLSRNPWIALTCLSQFIAFHSVSFTYIQWLYPTIMLVLLCYFPFCVLTTKFARASIRPHWRHHGAVLLIIFSILQILPRLQPRDNVLIGDGRFFYSMHQFHAAVTCRSRAIVRSHSGEQENEQEIDLHDRLPFVHVRLRCEPVTAIGSARALCRQRQRENLSIDDIDLYLDSQLIDQMVGEQSVLAIKDFCHSPYNSL